MQNNLKLSIVFFLHVQSAWNHLIPLRRSDSTSTTASNVDATTTTCTTCQEVHARAGGPTPSGWQDMRDIITSKEPKSTGDPCDIDPNSDPIAYAQGCATVWGGDHPVSSSTFLVVTTPEGGRSSESIKTSSSSATSVTRIAVDTPASSQSKESETRQASSSSISTTFSTSTTFTTSTTSTSRTTTPSSVRVTDHQDSKDKASSGTIIGAACGVFVALCLIVAVLWFTREKWRGYIKCFSRSSRDADSLDQGFLEESQPNFEEKEESTDESPTDPRPVTDACLSPRGFAGGEGHSWVIIDGVTDGGSPTYRVTNPDVESGSDGSDDGRETNRADEQANDQLPNLQSPDLPEDPSPGQSENTLQVPNGSNLPSPAPPDILSSGQGERTLEVPNGSNLQSPGPPDSPNAVNGGGILEVPSGMGRKQRYYSNLSNIYSPSVYSRPP